MLITPWLLARFGYRATYAGCMGLLMAGGLLGGLAQNYPLVLLARVIEGLATEVVMPIPALIIMRAFGPHEQGRAGGLIGIGVGHLLPSGQQQSLWQEAAEKAV